jgi:hypothetical protein
MLVLWLVACLAGIFAAARFRRHLRRHWQGGSWHGQDGSWHGQDGSWHGQDGNWHQWRQYQWRG